MSDQINDKFESAPAPCREFDLSLSAYFEGEDNPGVTSHAKECPFCSVVLADLELLRSEVTMLLYEDPPALVWANVRGALAAEGILRRPVKGWLKWFPRFGIMDCVAPLASLVCLAIFGALLLEPPLVVPPPEPPVIAAMVKSYRAREKYLDPAVQVSFRKGLQSLDNSIRECRDSIEKEPSNTLAYEYLATAYEQKAATLSGALEYDDR
jgi:hypothetical protein